MSKHTENCKFLLCSVHQLVYAVTTGGMVIAFADLSLSERPVLPSILLPSQDLNLHHQLSRENFVLHSFGALIKWKSAPSPIRLTVQFIFIEIAMVMIEI